MEELRGKRIAMMATDGFEEAELVETRKLLESAGAEVSVVAPSNGNIRAWNQGDWGTSVSVDQTLDAMSTEGFEALVIPGGVMSPDKLRMSERAVRIVEDFYEQGKVIGAICHGPWMLIEAGIANRHTIASWPSLQTDVRNAGGAWVNQEVVSDEGIVTSRKPEDIPAFARKIVEEMQEPRHEESTGRRRRERGRRAEMI